MATKKRKYSDEYLQVGFTSIMEGGVEKPECVIYNKVLGPDSMRPNKLRSHLQKVHPVHADKDASFFPTGGTFSESCPALTPRATSNSKMRLH